MKNKQILGSLLLTLVAITWGLAFAVKRIGMQSIEPVTFTAARMTLAAVAIGLVSVILSRSAGRKAAGNLEDAGIGENVSGESSASISMAESERQKKRDTLMGGACCGAFLAAANIVQQIGIVYTTAGKAGFLTAMYMLFVPIINLLLFKRRYPWLVWLAVLIGVVGMYLLCVNEEFHFARGDVFCLICAFLFGGHILCADHFVQKSDPVRMSAYQFVTCAMISWVAAFIMESPSWMKIVGCAIPILYCGIISGGMGYTLQILAQRWTDSTIASLLLSLESVFAAVFGALLLAEYMSIRETLGAIIMFAAIILVQVPLFNKKPKEN